VDSQEGEEGPPSWIVRLLSVNQSQTIPTQPISLDDIPLVFMELVVVG